VDAVFISYRRGDRSDAVDRICESLAKHLPNQKVFRDIHDIPLGADFPKLLREKLTEVSAVVVIIGPRWLEILKERRSAPNDSVDFVREEVRIALESDVKVIPVTVDGAAMPSKADLADFPDLLPLIYRSGTAVRPALDFATDVERLVKKLADPRASESVGAILEGKYRLIREIGEGGMGKVFEAEQTQPVRRQVAIKLIKLGMDTEEVLARFAAEKQALAVMDHPNIARVLDGGMTPLGRPFFVMELVQGKPITEFCDAKRLSTRERLALFDSACHAVHHAHQKLIIHRDIKPSNVLVEEIDGQHVLKVIDFGLAKALRGQRLTEKPWPSESGKQIGTLEYMSPEQAEGKHFDNLDTRSDIYSLGVLLYELLTGNPPFTRQELERIGEERMREVIRRDDPPIPSSRLSSSDALPSIAANRNLEPARLTKLLRNELDWIAMKALEKDRTRRYQSALGLAEEVERYLADEVVQARPPSVGYRARKFLRKHRGPVIAAGLVFIALVAGITGTTIGLLREAAQRQIAVDNERDAVKAKGEADAATADAVQARNRETVQLAIAIDEKKQAVKARERTSEVLDAMTSEITGDSLATQKAISTEQKKFLTTVLVYYKEFAGEKGDDELSRKRTAGSAYRVGLIEYRLGRKEESAVAFRLARDGFAALAADYPGVIKYRADLAVSHSSLGVLLDDFGKRTEAEVQYGKALTILERLAAEFPAVLEYRAFLANNHDHLAILFDDLGNQVEAEVQYRKALAIREKLVAEFPAVHKCRSDLASSYLNLGVLLRRLGKEAEAEEQYRKALAIQEKLATYYPAVPEYRAHMASSHSDLGNLLDDYGKRMEAEVQYRKALAIREKLTADFPAVPQYRADLASSHLNLGHLLEHRGKQTDGEEQFRQGLAIFEKLAVDFPTVPEYRAHMASSHSNLGVLLNHLGKQAEAEVQHRKALAIREKLMADFPAVPQYRADLASSHLNLGVLLADIGKRVEAEVQYRKTLAISEKLVVDFPAVPKYRADLASSHSNLGVVLAGIGKLAEAEVQFRKALAIQERLAASFPTTPEYRADLASSLGNLGIVLDKLGKLAEAEVQHRKGLAIRERLAVEFPAVPEYRSDLTSIHTNLGLLLINLHKWSDSEEQFRKALAVQEKLVAEYPAVPEYRKKAMARQVANAASKAACFSTKRSAVWIMRTVKSVTESLGGHSRIPLQSALGRRGEPGKRSSQPGNSPTRDEKHLGNPGFQ
jgi:serine/threonine protein kinase/Flp pilus assembly protein TadD